MREGSMQLKWKCHTREFMHRVFNRVCMRVCLCKIQVFVNPLLDSDDVEPLISAPILIRGGFLTAALFNLQEL